MGISDRGLGIYFFTISILVIGGFFLYLLTDPSSLEKAALEERKGHKLYSEGRLGVAAKYFVKSANRGGASVDVSRRYRCAGDSVQSLGLKVEYYRLALKFDAKNKEAIAGLRRLSEGSDFTEVAYIARYPDGWSRGASGRALITEAGLYEVQFFTSAPADLAHEVTIYINGEWDSVHRVFSGQKYWKKVRFADGIHEMEISISKTFNPKQLERSTDDRDLGVNFAVYKVEKASG